MRKYVKKIFAAVIMVIIVVCPCIGYAKLIPYYGYFIDIPFLIISLFIFLGLLFLLTDKNKCKDTVGKKTIPALVVALAGIPISYALVKPYFQHIIFGIAFSFILIGTFLFFIDKKLIKFYKTIAFVILVFGALSGFLIGYRSTHVLPWRWTSNITIAVVGRSYMDWVAAIIPWSVFASLGIALWIIGIFNSKKTTKTNH